MWKDLHYFEMIFVVIFMKPNVLPGVRVGQTSMVNNLSLKGGGMLWQWPPGHRHTRGLSHLKCRQEPSIDGTIGTVGPLVPSTEGATIKTTAPVNIPSDVSRHSTCKVHFISWVNFCPERHKFNTRRHLRTNRGRAKRKISHRLHLGSFLSLPYLPL